MARLTRWTRKLERDWLRPPERTQTVSFVFFLFSRRDTCSSDDLPNCKPFEALDLLVTYDEICGRPLFCRVAHCGRWSAAVANGPLVLAKTQSNSVKKKEKKRKENLVASNPQCGQQSGTTRSHCRVTDRPVGVTRWQPTQHDVGRVYRRPARRVYRVLPSLLRPFPSSAAFLVASSLTELYRVVTQFHLVSKRFLS